MIDAALENSFPLLVLLSEVSFAKRPQDHYPGGPIIVAFHWILEQPAKSQQSGRGDRGSGCVQQLAAFGRCIEIPCRNAIVIGMGNEIVGTGFGGLKKPGVAAVLVRDAETIQ